MNGGIFRLAKIAKAFPGVNPWRASATEQTLLSSLLGRIEAGERVAAGKWGDYDDLRRLALAATMDRDSADDIVLAAIRADQDAAIRSGKL